MIKRAYAVVKGGTLYPNINGAVFMTQYKDGVEVVAKIHNLPKFSREDNKFIGPFGFHIHDGGSCQKGNDKTPFPLAGRHYNPTNAPHGNHAGDLPVLMPMSNNTAIMKIMTDKFKLEDVAGLAIVVHLYPDDYRTDPDGASGPKIACGIIQPY